MNGVKYISTTYLVLLLMTSTSGQRCSRRLIHRQKNYNLTQLFPASILVRLTLPNSCVNRHGAWLKQFHVRYGLNGAMHSETHNVSSLNQSITLSDLLPNKKYEVYFVIEYESGDQFFSRPVFVMSGEANSTNTNQTNTTTIPTTITSVGDHDKASNAGGIAAGIIIPLITVVIVTVIISLWLIRRRRMSIKKHKGTHYVSVVSIIGNESLSTKKKLYSRPGYLQIFHDPMPAVAYYEVPIKSSAKSDPANSENPAGTEERPSISDKDVMLLKSEPIELLSTNMTTSSTSKLEVHRSAQVKKKKLVKPYAVVDMADIAAKAGLDGIASKHKSKQQKNKCVPSNKEALSHSFGSCAEDSSTTTQVELNGRYYTVPAYVNLPIPMTVNP